MDVVRHDVSGVSDELAVSSVSSVSTQNTRDRFHTKVAFCVYGMQFVMALLVIAFCAYQLISLDSCESQVLYTGIITMITGVYLPTPKIKHK